MASFHSFGVSGHFSLIFGSPCPAAAGSAKAMLELLAYFLFQDKK
jgi:hypothetical protein